VTTKTASKTVKEATVDEIAALVAADLNKRGGYNAKVLPRHADYAYRNEIPLVVKGEKDADERRFTISVGKGAGPVVYFKFKDIGSRKRDLAAAVEDVADAIVKDVDRQRWVDEAARKDEEARRCWSESRRLSGRPIRSTPASAPATATRTSASRAAGSPRSTSTTSPCPPTPTRPSRRFVSSRKPA